MTQSLTDGSLSTIPTSFAEPRVRAIESLLCVFRYVVSI